MTDISDERLLMTDMSETPDGRARRKSISPKSARPKRFPSDQRDAHAPSRPTHSAAAGSWLRPLTTVSAARPPRPRAPARGPREEAAQKQHLWHSRPDCRRSHSDPPGGRISVGPAPLEAPPRP